MTTWNQHSNAADVLGLGPRTAGRLLQLGVRTAEQLVEACPERLARKLQDPRFSAPVVAAWQREVQLRLEVSELPDDAARVLAAIGFSSLKELARATPTELLAEVQLTLHQQRNVLWLAEMTPPTVASVAGWIRIAGEQCKKNAA